MKHPGSSVQHLEQATPLFSVHPAQQAVFVALTAKHLSGTRNTTTRQLADAYAAIHGLFHRSPHRTSRRGREGDWLRISMNQLAAAMGATYATAKRRIHQLDQLGLVTYTRLGYAANDWFLAVTDLPTITPKPTAPQPRAQNELHMERKMDSPSYVSQRNTLQRAGGGREIDKHQSRREGNHALPAELLPYLDEAFEALKARGMGRGRASFHSVIAATAGCTTAEVRQALINLATSTLQLITPDLWAKQLQGTQRPGGTLQPFKFDFRSQEPPTPSSATPLPQPAVAPHRQTLSEAPASPMRSTAAPMPQPRTQTAPTDASEWQAIVSHHHRHSLSGIIHKHSLWMAIPEHLRQGVTPDQVHAYLASTLVPA